MVIDDLKILLPSANEIILNLYIRKATTLIVAYMNNDKITDAELYPDAVIEYVTISMNKRGNEGLQSFGQGSRSGTYVTGLTDTVKALLPPPYVRMLGVKSCKEVDPIA
ncbi:MULTISPECIES: phage head-tail connector protein [Clostridium]|uniref:Phage head-tail connector protein n=1 Tax=Clostridium frigoriphilum TaxID=443253 RepID=A0ABU7UJT7_9CLOT|nr:phage head-tail connector protein [Clostridium sp. DSM 17811]MBU3098381.1 phage head-tail connector protein [Clostridium sp. DSM 17811]